MAVRRGCTLLSPLIHMISDLIVPRRTSLSLPISMSNFFTRGYAKHRKESARWQTMWALMSKPSRRNIGNSRSLKQLRGFNVGIRHANHVTLHGFRSLGRACILLKTFVGITFQFCFLESQDHWLWEKFLYILITLCTVCTRVYCSVTLNSN